MMPRVSAPCEASLVAGNERGATVDLSSFASLRAARNPLPCRRCVMTAGRHIEISQVDPDTNCIRLGDRWRLSDPLPTHQALPPPGAPPAPPQSPPPKPPPPPP